MNVMVVALYVTEILSHLHALERVRLYFLRQVNFDTIVDPNVQLVGSTMPTVRHSKLRDSTSPRNKNYAQFPDLVIFVESR